MKVFQVTTLHLKNDEVFLPRDLGRWCVRDVGSIQLFDTRDEADAVVANRRIHHMKGHYNG